MESYERYWKNVLSPVLEVRDDCYAVRRRPEEQYQLTEDDRSADQGAHQVEVVQLTRRPRQRGQTGEQSEDKRQEVLII